MYMIETKNLTKTYRRFIKPEGLGGSIQSLWKREYIEKTAVSGMDFVMEEGEFTGLIGPNGAGKTTMMKMLTGIIAPTSGQISVMGYVPSRLQNEFKRQYAIVMGQKSQLFFELTANDTLRLFKEIYGLEEKEYQETKAYFTELFDVKELMDVQVRTLSLGERMKMELMAALLHNPRILFLDEPTIGLDVIAAGQIRRFLHEINRDRGTSIILTSHYMEDIRELCGRSVVISHGQKIYDGKTAELFDRYQKEKQITAEFQQPSGQLELPEFARLVTQTPHRLTVRVPKERTGDMLRLLMRYQPTDVNVEEEETGTVVERIYGEEGDLQGSNTRKETGKAAANQK